MSSSSSIGTYTGVGGLKQLLKGVALIALKSASLLEVGDRIG